MKCYKCQSENSVKAGFIRGIQRYKCKECGCFYSVEKKSDVKTPEQKRLALEMYLEGLGFRSIGRILNISYGTVYQWVKKWEAQTELPQSNEPVKIMELDEIHSYVQNKKTIAGADWLLIDLENASSTLFVESGIPKPFKNSGTD